MFDFIVASAKLLQIFLVMLLCSPFLEIVDFFLPDFFFLGTAASFLVDFILGTAAAAAAVKEITTGSMAAVGSAAVGSDSICGTAVAAFVDVAAVDIAVVAAGVAVVAASVAAVGPDVICGTAADWFHVVDYAC